MHRKLINIFFIIYIIPSLCFATKGTVYCPQTIKCSVSYNSCQIISADDTGDFALFVDERINNGNNLTGIYNFHAAHAEGSGHSTKTFCHYDTSNTDIGKVRYIVYKGRGILRPDGGKWIYGKICQYYRDSKSCPFYRV